MYSIVVCDNTRKIQCGAIFITQYETTSSIEACLQLIKDHHSETNVQFAPKIYFTDKDAGQIAAIKNVWPDCRILLCQLHAVRAWNRSITTSSATNSLQADRVKDHLKDMMYAGTTYNCHAIKNKILRMRLPNNLRQYLQSEWFLDDTIEMWCMSYRNDLYRNRTDTTNIVESFNQLSEYLFQP